MGAPTRKTIKMPKLPNALWKPIDLSSLSPEWDLEIVEMPTGWKKLDPMRSTTAEKRSIGKFVEKIKKAIDTAISPIPNGSKIRGSKRSEYCPVIGWHIALVTYIEATSMPRSKREILNSVRMTG